MLNFLEEKAFAQQGIREENRREQARQFLDRNPQFETRFTALTDRYPMLPAEMLQPMALETNIPVDSQAFGDLNDHYAKEMMAQQANTWYNQKYGGYKTGNADDLIANYYSTVSYQSDESEIQAMFKERRKSDRTILTPVRAFTNWLVALGDGMSELLIKYNPGITGSEVERPKIRLNKETGEFEVDPGNIGDLSTFQQGLTAIPGGQFLIPNNRPQFIGRVFAYAQQLNALDRFVESGYTLNDAQQFLPIDFSKSEYLDDIGTKEGWLAETKGWMKFAKEAAEVGGSPYVFEMVNQLRKGEPINMNNKRWFRVESVMAENDPTVKELMDMGYSKLESQRRFYEEKGIPIVKPNKDTDINWTSIQKPNQIEIFSGRRAVLTPALADQQAVKNNLSVNAIAGVKEPYSYGRYQAGLKYRVGTEQYNVLSGWIDGSLRAVSELGFYKGVKTFKKLQKLSRTVNPLTEISKEGLFSPLKKKEIVNNWIKTNKQNPLNGKPIDNVDEFIQNFDSYESNFIKPLTKQIKDARKKTNKLKKEWGLVGGKLRTTFAKSGNDLVDVLKDSGVIKAYALNKSGMALEMNPFTKFFPPEIKKLMLDPKIDETGIEALFRRMYGNGIRTPGMDQVFMLDSLPKGTSALASNVASKIAGKNVVVPSVGSLAGRAINRSIRTVDETITKSKDIFKSNNLIPRKTKYMDDTQVVSKADFVKWQDTGLISTSRNMGFYSELTAGMSPRFKKLFAIQPGTTLSYNNKAEAYRTMVNHMMSTGYDTYAADRFIDAFLDMKFTITNVRDLAKKMGIYDAGMVGKRKGEKAAKIMRKYIDDKFAGETRVENYINDPTGKMMPDMWSPRIVSETGQTTFIPSATKIVEMNQQGAPLTNNRALNKMLSGFFDIDPNFDMSDFFATTKTYAESLKKKGHKIRIPTKTLEEGTVNQSLDVLLNTVIKPNLIAKPALTQRVVLEEQIAFAVFPQLFGMISFQPQKYFSWMFSYGYIPKAKYNPFSILAKNIIDSGKDVNEVTMSHYFHDAINAQLSLSNLNLGNINKRLIDYVPVSSKNSLALDGYVFQYTKAWQDPIMSALAAIPNGTPDEIIKWSKTKEALKLRDRLISLSGNKYIGNYETSIRRGENWVRYLFQKEGEIRMRTGMPMKEGKDYFYFPEGMERAGEAVFDISHPFVGSSALREGIATGKFIDANGNAVNLAPRYWDNNPYETFKLKDERKLKEGLESFIDKVDEITNEKIYDFGSVVVPKPELVNKYAQLGGKLDALYGGIFEVLLQSPTARMNRSPIFKQYRWLKLSANFHKFSPSLQKKLIKEAETAKIPKYMLDDIRGVTASGSINDYEGISNFANSFAVQNMKSILYDTKNKHRVSEIFRNVYYFPEVFIEIAKRWGKAVAANPYSLKAASNASMGAQSVGGNISYYGQGVWQEDPLTGEMVFLYPWQPMHSANAFGQDARFRANTVGYGSGVNMVSTQGWPSAQPMVQYAQNLLFDSKAGQMLGFDQEFQDEFFGDFPPPESLFEAFNLGQLPFVQKFRTSGNPVDVIREKFSDTYVDSDNMMWNWDMNNKFNSMRAETTIEFWEDIKISDTDLIYLENGHIDKYIKTILPEWDGNRKLPTTQEMAEWFAENDNQPYEYKKGELSWETLDRALLMYSAHEARWFALTRGITQFGAITTQHLRSAVQDKTGKWWSTVVLAKEYDDLVQKYGDHRLAAEEFSIKFGLDHGYILTSTKDKSPVATVWDVKVKEWKDKHSTEINTLPLTYHYLNPSNPENERTYSDVIAQATVNPEAYLLSANDTVAWFKYDRFQEQTERAVNNGDISTAQKESMDKSFRLALIETHPGFQESFGQTEPATVQNRFKELRDKWTTSDFVENYDAGQGFIKYMEFWKEAEQISRDTSGSGSSTWWLTSNDSDAHMLRRSMADAAYSIIVDHPDFLHVYQNVIIRLWSSDRDVLEYNSYLYNERRMFGDK